MERGKTILENTNAKRIKRAYNAFMNSETRFQALYSLEQLESAIVKYNQYTKVEKKHIASFIGAQEGYIVRCLMLTCFNSTQTKFYVTDLAPYCMLKIVATSNTDIAKVSKLDFNMPLRMLRMYL